MSAQTGVETPRGPRSQHMGDRVRYRFALWRAQPNPLWMREMRQSTRQTRTPVILTVLTVLCTLLMTTIGSGLSSSSSPAESGNILFHVFFSLAFFGVTRVGPALAANSIASEREGKTWEAVLLTGVRPAEIARGKFLAAYTAIGMYVVALAPVAPADVDRRPVAAELAAPRKLGPRWRRAQVAGAWCLGPRWRSDASGRGHRAMIK